MTLKTDSYVIGSNADDTRNFLLDTDLAGGLRIRRKSDGSGGTVLTVDSAGVISLPKPHINANNVAFSAYNSSVASVNGATKIALQTEEFDVGGYFDSSSNYRFTPLVAGYYQINGSVQIAGSPNGFVAIYKNGSAYKYGNQTATAVANPQWVVSSIVYLNGSTDYVELYASTPSAMNTVNSAGQTYLNGALISRTA